ncbi:spermidine/putrescine ABC transporter, periplasmic spermidine/putrescine-binding protein PotD [Methylococcus capsulatus str. Bath]|jgi:spermidine/putrescine transport system substrate-binding protein|uniref:Putrescine-binding periplasmic protein n=1 Tax=Methylococcus capsulatus (strain ATCC 33009 / NCIMB 11132 / Bath) TaxID=243233 RepID=Q60AI4_METCA|nr:extracellular solute-binding protein [Methylococcus capsulatus]AAU93014.1 spermidine/putrescine ABC transporter, periplasmic spermidine/putrescine-binding protein PotD [Methylococcus capsulatus str. Bath]
MAAAQRPALIRRAAFLLVAFLVPVAAGQRELHFFNWSDYLPPAVLENFTRETGIQVHYATYDSNEAMYAKVKLLEGGGYDLVVPSTYMVDRMRKQGLLRPLDRSLLPHFGNLDPHHLDLPFDPENRYSVPYLWGMTGIGVNAERIDPASLHDWADLWQPRFRRALLLPNDMREVFHMAMRVLGLPVNSTDPAHIDAAYRKLRALMPNVRLFSSDAPQILFITGEVDAGMIWNGVAYLAARETPAIRFVQPPGGPLLWMDNLAILRNATNPDEAHALIDYLLQPEVARLISETVGYATPNAAAIAILPPEIRNDPLIYPPADVLERGEYQVDLGEAIGLYTEYWERLKAGQ